MRKRVRSREGRRQFPEYSDEMRQKSVASALRRRTKGACGGGERKQQLENVFELNPPSAPLHILSVVRHNPEILPFLRCMMF